jgi:putative inorganic carbon (hco3(-)) transporter
MTRLPHPITRGQSAGAPADPEAPLPWDGLLICMAAMLLVSVARLHSLVPGLDMIRPALLLSGLSLLLYFTRPSPLRALKYLKHPFAYLMLFIAIWALLGVPVALFKSNSLKFLLEEFFRTGVMVILLAACVRSLHDVRRLLMTLAIGGMVFSLFAALPAGFNAVSAGGYDPNDSSMFIVLTMPLTAYFLIREPRLMLKLVFAAALVVCTIAVVRTGSRGGFLALVAIAGYTIFFFQGIKPIFRLGTVGMLALVLALAGSQEFWDKMESINDPTDYNYTDPLGRKAVWARAREYMVQNPVFGVGINNFSTAEGVHPYAVARKEAGYGWKWSVAHSIWYQTGAELGFPGLAAFAGIFLAGAYYLRRMARRVRATPGSPQHQEAAGLASALIGSMVAIAVAGTFLSLAYSSMVWAVFGLILGLLKVMRFRSTGNASWQPAAAVRRVRRTAFPAHAGLR